MVTLSCLGPWAIAEMAVPGSLPGIGTHSLNPRSTYLQGQGYPSKDAKLTTINLARAQPGSGGPGLLTRSGPLLPPDLGLSPAHVSSFDTNVTKHEVCAGPSE